ncbi:MAG: hypothetical protein COV36_00920 [Alphaproteobacteria bacterium CG11_big_fil_rev_8_21_14_0_20_44_7]|nr:MAG: hypothetical protein COV36_00920 [Alphaproteobacteria bacterium CG11_big_fil_rev_8_21_14_0_20_44_7]
MNSRIYNFFKESFLAEYHRWVVWIPVIFACGIIAYFSLKYEPSIALVAGLLTKAFIIYAILRWKLPKLRLVGGCLIIAALGFATAKFHAENSNIVKITEDTGKITLSGNVEEISFSKGFPRYTLTNLRIDEMPAEKIPEKIRLSVRTRIKGDIRPGDRVITDAVLLPPPSPVIPGGYDFARSAYFDRLGATGYAVKTLVRLKDGHEEHYLDGLRHNITQKIKQDVEGDDGAIAAALITGDRSAIPEKIMEDMRLSGLAHLLAISGLHLTLVAGVFFFSIRSLLALNYKLSERYSIKKISAIAAIFGALAYLLLSGMSVSAQRAFLMVSLVLLAVAVDRAATPMRSVAFAALIILIILPESIMMPGFQMSFMAVLCLISMYEVLTKRFYRFLPSQAQSPRNRILRTLIIWPLSAMLTSLLAGTATAPFAAYHFNRFAAYSLLANIFAVPMVTFIVMPAGVLAMILMPFGLEEIGLYIMGRGIEVILFIANKIAAIPGSSVSISQFSSFSLCLISFGMIWLFIWQKAWRLIGVVFIAGGLILAANVEKPDVIIAENGKLYALAIDGKLHFSNRRKSFKSDEWRGAFGQEEILKLPKQDVYEVDGKTVSFNCAEADIVADVKGQGCKGKQLTISLQELQSKGGHVVYIRDGNIRLENVAEARGERLWTR